MRIPIGDIFFLSLRLTVAASFVLYFGLVYGFLLCCGANFLNNLVMKLCFGLEALHAVDELFILDDERNVANIVSAIILEKTDIDKLEAQLYAQAGRFFRTQAKLVKVMGKYYYKRMDEAEYNSKKQRFCQRIASIATEQELVDLMAREQQIRDPLDQVQYKTIFIENFG